MAFDEIQFPADISYGATGGPVYSTDVVQTAGGHEQRNTNWSESLAVYNVSHGVKSKTQLDTLIEFFRARQGKSRGFRFKDYTDFDVTGQAIGIGDNIDTTFQLIKSYTSGAVSYSRTITKPVSGTVKIYFDTVEQTTGWTVDTTTGIVTFTIAPTSGVSITTDFEFDVPVRFDADQLQATMDDYGVYSWNRINLVEVRK
jgi:uncharacterized protein (TIGR02217 family)